MQLVENMFQENILICLMSLSVYFPFLCISVSILLSFKKVFLVGAIAKLGATVTTYPLLVVKVNSVIVPSFSSILLFTIKKNKGP